MKSSDLSKIRKAMEKVQDRKRYEHTLGVAYTAASLAMRYQVDIGDALLAGLLHDCAKCLSDEKKISLCEKHNIPISEIERRNPALLHSKVGSFLAMEQYKVTNMDVINAILNHTTGRPGMSDLEKIIFVADYIEPGRRQAPNLTAIRRTAFLDLDETLLMILGDTLAYLKESDIPIDRMTRKTYDYYREKCGEGQGKETPGAD